MFANLSLCASFILSACAFVHRYACSLVCLQPVVPVALMWQLRSSGGKLTCVCVYVYRCMLVCLYDCVLVRRCVPRVPACLNGRKLVFVCAGACACACGRLNAY